MNEHPEGSGAQVPASPVSYPVEPKVKAATVAAGGTGATAALLLWLLGTYVFRGAVPLPVEAFVDTVVVGALSAAGAWIAGWWTRHAPRW